MTDLKKHSKLFSEFPEISTKEWEEKIIADLKGADYDKKLVWHSLEGFKVRPYYRSEDVENLHFLETEPGQFPYLRGNKATDNSWFIRQDVEVENFEQANKTALELLSKGVTSLGFIISNNLDITKEGIINLLDGVDALKYELNFASSQNDVLFDILAESFPNAKVSIDIAPLRNLSVKGTFCVSTEKVFDVVQGIISKKKDLPDYKLISVRADTIHNAGSSIVQELAFGLSMGAEYLVRLSDRGLAVDDIAPAMKFSFATGSNYFMEIAKLRAARLLWSKIVESFGLQNAENAKMFIHSTSSGWNKTIYDPAVNMLRTTTEAMSAILGGTDSLTLEAFNKSFEKSTAFSERIARNQQLLLKEESYLDKVVDPAAGSYYIENLTKEIANEAWELFLKVDEKGGYIQAFIDGYIQNEIKRIAQERDRRIATRREIILGTNQYPNFNEAIDFKALNLNDESNDNVAKDSIAEPLRIYRGAQAFEQMRLATDKYAKSFKRPKVFMFNIGNFAMRKARAQFACNFFACAGFEVEDNNGFNSIAEGVEAVSMAKADIVVVCSSDSEYAELVPDIFNQIKNTSIMVVAGAPACMHDLEAKGINNFIHVKSDVLETLKYYQKQLGIII